MARTLAGALLEAQQDPSYRVICSITNTSPLTITVLGASGVLADKAGTLTYSVGTNNAWAFVSKRQRPLVIPIG